MNPIRLAEEIIDQVFDAFGKSIDRNTISAQDERRLRNDIATMIDDELKKIEQNES